MWTKGLITPIYKSVDQSDPSNYRGICVTSCLGKLFCSILNIRVLEFVQTRNILHLSQIVFLPGNRTSYHLFSLKTLTDKYVSNTNKGKLFCCFVDFCKAFDSNWHPGLPSKLLSYEIGGHFFNLISNIYSKTECSIKMNQQRTDYFRYDRGVRQRRVLSPILFNLYMNDLLCILGKTSNCDPIVLPSGSLLNSVFYADDLVLYKTKVIPNKVCIIRLYTIKYCLVTI